MSERVVFEALGVAGAPAPGRLTTTFRAGSLLVDAGAFAHGLAGPEADKIKDVLLTHAHLDHTLGLPFRLAHARLRVWGLEEVLDAVRESLLDGRIYPDMSDRVDWRPLEIGQTAAIGEFEVRVGPAAHGVPCLSFALKENGRTTVIVGDTSRQDPVVEWVAGEAPDRVVLECSFPDRLRELAVEWGHQSPSDFLHWRKALGPKPAFFVTHLKPGLEDEIENELSALSDPALTVLRQGDRF
ncbi:MAG: MBL fold metallo-hydrolase [Planctomycetota bacterium]